MTKAQNLADFNRAAAEKILDSLADWRKIGARSLCVDKNGDLFVEYKERKNEAPLCVAICDLEQFAEALTEQFQNDVDVSEIDAWTNKYCEKYGLYVEDNYDALLEIFVELCDCWEIGRAVRDAIGKTTNDVDAN